MTFAEKLQKLRKEKGLSQGEFAKAVSVSKRTVAAWETDGIYPRKRETYQQLADFFDVDVNYLLVDNDNSCATEANADQLLLDAHAILEQAKVHFAGNTLSPQDKLQFLQDIQAIFLDAHGIKDIE